MYVVHKNVYGQVYFLLAKVGQTPTVPGFKRKVVARIGLSKEVPPNVHHGHWLNKVSAGVVEAVE